MESVEFQAQPDALVFAKRQTLILGAESGGALHQRFAVAEHTEGQRIGAGRDGRLTRAAQAKAGVVGHSRDGEIEVDLSIVYVEQHPDMLRREAARYPERYMMCVQFGADAGRQPAQFLAVELLADEIVDFREQGAAQPVIVLAAEIDALDSIPRVDVQLSGIVLGGQAEDETQSQG